MPTESSFAKFLRRLAQEEASGRRVMRGGDSAHGLEINKLNSCHKVSKNIWDVDIGRTPHVVKGILDPRQHGRFGIQEKAWSANKYNQMIYYRENKVTGGGF